MTTPGLGAIGALFVIAATIAATSGVSTDQVRTAAPVAISGTAQSEGSSLSVARADHQHGVTGGTITLSSASPSTGTATVPSGAKCLCTNQTTQANAIKCAVSSTTLTATGPNTVTDVVTYLCF